MKKNSLYKTVKKSGLAFVIMFWGSQNIHAQFSNEGDVKVSNGTILSINMDYSNKITGKFINDGLVYAFENWNNDGTVSYTAESKGKTFFKGAEEQIIEGAKISDFQNVLFENIKSRVPFHLAGKISVGGMAEFNKGIINADSYDGKVTFKENATHSNASDLSFVDGKVEKQGKEAFEFPVGDELYFRPSYHAAGAGNNVYTTQYFYKNSGDVYNHNLKEESILLINNKEYWNVTEDSGADKIVLSLTMRNQTTPSDFFNPASDTEVAIVRWDEVQGKWLNEGGVVSDAATGETYSNLLTSQVSGYGIFTMAIVKKTPPPPDELIVYNGISPNGDGKNDSFLIKGIDKYPDNEVEIYNRWGVKVYSAKSYNESDVMFRGYSDGRATVNRGEKLPTGTYFYILKYNDGNKGFEKSGYLYINNQ
jgi:gliding motility-associated-like protein